MTACRPTYWSCKNEVAGKIVATLAEKLIEAEDERMGEGEASAGHSYLMLGIAYLGRFAEDAVMLPQQLLRSLSGSAEQGSEVVDRSSQARAAANRSGGPA